MIKYIFLLPIYLMDLALTLIMREKVKPYSPEIYSLDPVIKILNIIIWLLIIFFAAAAITLKINEA